METISCPICGSADQKPFMTVHDRLSPQQNESFNLVKCRCTFVFLNPRPNSDEMVKYYKLNGYDPHRRKSSSIRDAAYRIVQIFANRQKLKRISRYRAEGNLLDIGAGQGKFGNFMSGKGWDVSLQDSYSAYQGNLQFYKNISDIESDQSYDIITLWHVMEHLHDLENNLKSMNQFLKNSGYLIMAVPNIHAWERQYYNCEWAPFDAPRHLYHFSEHTLKTLLENNDYSVCDTFAMPQDTPYNILLSMKKKSPSEIAKGIHVCVNTWLQTLKNGCENSSTIMVVCRKK